MKLQKKAKKLCDEAGIKINSYGSYYRVGSKDADEWKKICEIGYTTYAEIPAVEHLDADNDGVCDFGGEDITCKDCGEPAHDGLMGNILCWLKMLINLFISMFK